MSLHDRARRGASASASLGAVLLAALIPKCPLCVAAALSALGVGAALGGAVAPLIRPIAFLVAVVLTVAIGVTERRRHKRRCCAKSTPSTPH
jgi:hypothetical protein